MRQIISELVEKGRDRGTPGPGPHGCFDLWCPVHERKLIVLATDGRFDQQLVDEAHADPQYAGHTFTPDHPIFWWEHVSVSGKYYAPNWAEMCWVKDQFWFPEDVVVQFHVPPEDHVDIAKTCLHLWRLIPGKVRCEDLVVNIDGNRPDTGNYLFLNDFPRPPAIAVGPKDSKPK